MLLPIAMFWEGSTAAWARPKRVRSNWRYSANSRKRRPISSRNAARPGVRNPGQAASAERLLPRQPLPLYDGDKSVWSHPCDRLLGAARPLDFQPLDHLRLIQPEVQAQVALRHEGGT